jgi:1-acyl-sn-glycerol-3-phosphate acyltransferase
VARPSASLPDPLSQYSALLFRGFARYLRWYVGRHFNAVLVAAEGLPRLPADKPLIVYCNHPSWWDPLLFALVGDALFPGRRGYGPMEASSLDRYSILKRVGAFGIDRESARGGVVFMLQARRILSRPSSVLWLTAEGAFTDVRHRPVSIRAGLGHLARLSADAIVIPLAIEYTFWNESRPVALCRFGEAFDLGQRGVHPASEWNRDFEAALSRTMDQLAADSLRRDPSGFRSLLKGSAGVGGIYDVWRRMRAWSQGRAFDAAHEQEP